LESTIRRLKKSAPSLKSFGNDNYAIELMEGRKGFNNLWHLTVPEI